MRNKLYPLLIFLVFLSSTACYEPRLGHSAPGGKKVRTRKALSSSPGDIMNMDWETAINPYNREAEPNLAESALLVVCMQQFFTGSESKGMARKIIPAINSLIRSARSAGIPVLFLQQGARNEKEKNNEVGSWWGRSLAPDADGFDLDPSLSRSEKDTVVLFPHYSAFKDTDLNKILLAAGAKDIIITGVVTNVQVESTARDAFAAGFRVFLPADATATPDHTLKLATMRNMAFGFGHIADSRSITEMIKKAVKDHGGKIPRSSSGIQNQSDASIHSKDAEKAP